MIFGFFRKKQQPSILDGLIHLTYGNSPPTNTKDPQQAIRLAHEILLVKIFPLAEVETVAMRIHGGLFPYSIHGLAVATATNLIHESTGLRRKELIRIQVSARMVVIDWVHEKKVAPLIAQTFEEALHRAIEQGIEQAPESSESQNIEKLAEIVVKAIELQLNLANKTSLDVKYHRWPLGYCFGALDSVAQLYGFNFQTDGIALVTKGFSLIFSDRESEKYVRRCLELQQDNFFAEGREHGGDDFHQWLTTKGEFKPLMLMNFFAFGKPNPLQRNR